jgi:hypothetical protein
MFSLSQEFSLFLETYEALETPRLSRSFAVQGKITERTFII